jgi:hypothetical protein
MPVETRTSEDFGKLVSSLIGEDSLGKVTIKTGISQAYLVAMRRGKVPSELIIQKFAKGMADRWPNGYDDLLQTLRIAADYEEPADPAEAISSCVHRQRILGKLNPDKERRINELVREIIEEVDGK